MATTLKRRTRARGRIVPLDETIEKYFRTGKEPERDTPAFNLRCSRFFDDGAEIGRVWRHYRAFLLKRWTAEGRKRTWMK